METDEMTVSLAVLAGFVLSFFLNLVFCFFMFDYLSFEFGKWSASYSNNSEVMRRAEACYIVTYLAPLNKISEGKKKEYLNPLGIDTGYCRNMINLSKEFK